MSLATTPHAGTNIGLVIGGLLQSGLRLRLAGDLVGELCLAVELCLAGDLAGELCLACEICVKGGLCLAGELCLKGGGLHLWGATLTLLLLLMAPGASLLG
jgi:hypothetical protein